MLVFCKVWVRVGIFVFCIRVLGGFVRYGERERVVVNVIFVSLGFYIVISFSFIIGLGYRGIIFK